MGIGQDGHRLGGNRGIVRDASENSKVDQRLALSEARFRALVTTGGTTIYRMSPDWRFLYELDSQDFLAPVGEPIAHWPSLYILEEDQPMVMAAIEKVKRTRGIFELEHRVRLADGSIGWVLSRAVPMFGENGEIFEWFGAASNVTARKQAEGALQSREQELRVITDNVPAMIGFYDREFRYRVINEEYCRFFNRPREQIIGRTVEEVAGEAIFASLRPWMEKALAGEKVKVEDRGWRAAAPDTWSWTEENYIPRFTESGEVDGFYALIFDITDRKRAEAAFRESEEQYHSLFETMDQGYALCKLVRDETGKAVDYRFLQVNPAFGTYTGREAKDVVGKLRSEVIPVHDERTLAIAEHVVETGAPVRLEHMNMSLDRWFDTGLYPRSNDRFAALFSDISDRKHQERNLREQEARHRADLERKVRDRTAELKQSRDLLQATMDSSVDMIEVFEAIRDTSGKIVDFRWLLNNHTSESRYGSVEGESLLQRHPWVVVEGIFDAFSRVTETGVPEQAERHYAHDQFNGWFYQSVVKLGDGVATTTKEITDWKQAQQEVLRLRDEVAQAKLRESEERLRQFGEASQDILWIRDAATLQCQYLTPAFEPIYGLSREEALGEDSYRTWLELILPEDRETAGRAMEAVRQGQQVSFEYRIRRPVDGQVRWLRDTDFPIMGDDGQVLLVGGIGTDVTEAKATQERLRQNEERLRSAVEVGRLGLWDWNVETGEVSWSDEHFRLQGYAVGEVVPSYKAWLDRLHPEDREATDAAVTRSMHEKEEFLCEFRVLHPDESVHWIYGRGRFFYDDQGEPIRMVGAVIDVTQRKEWEDRLQVLVLELQHRTRNLLGVVRSLANTTMRSSTNLADFHAAFLDRLAALARVNGLLSRLNEGDRIHLEELLDAELWALGMMDGARSKLTLQGPKGVRLRSSTVQTFALAVHELATNALKYGAFASPEGRLSIRWRLEKENGRTFLHLEWKESDVVLPQAATETGYGRELIERALPYQLKAQTTYQLEDYGVRCTIRMPISEA